MRGLVVRFFADEIGATAIEYSLIAAGIAMAVIAAVNALGTAVNLDFEDVKNNLQ
jgi:pilus assembly protein Flp/PilA